MLGLARERHPVSGWKKGGGIRCAFPPEGDAAWVEARAEDEAAAARWRDLS